MRYYEVGLRGNAGEDRYAVPQAIVAEGSAAKAKVLFLRFLRRNGVTTAPSELVVKATGVQVPHTGVGPHVTRSETARELTRVQELDPLPFSYEMAKHGSFDRDPWEVTPASSSF